MEKTVVFGPIIIFFAIFFFLILAFFRLIFKLIKKQKNSFWTGVLVDKTYNQVNDDNSSITHDYYTLIFQTEEGKKVNVGVNRSMYNDFKIGDKAEKSKGDLRPHKI